MSQVSPSVQLISSVRLAFILWVLLVASVGAARAQGDGSFSQTCDVYFDWRYTPPYVTSPPDGSFEAPFPTFTDSTLHLQLNCTSSALVLLHFTPGTYALPILPMLPNLALQRCLNCPPAPPGFNIPSQPGLANGPIPDFDQILSDPKSSTDFRQFLLDLQDQKEEDVVRILFQPNRTWWQANSEPSQILTLRNITMESVTDLAPYLPPGFIFGSEKDIITANLVVGASSQLNLEHVQWKNIQTNQSLISTMSNSKATFSFTSFMGIRTDKSFYGRTGYSSIITTSSKSELNIYGSIFYNNTMEDSHSSLVHSLTGTAISVNSPTTLTQTAFIRNSINQVYIPQAAPISPPASSPSVSSSPSSSSSSSSSSPITEPTTTPSLTETLPNTASIGLDQNLQEFGPFARVKDATAAVANDSPSIRVYVPSVKGGALSIFDGLCKLHTTWFIENSVSTNATNIIDDDSGYSSGGAIALGGGGGIIMTDSLFLRNLATVGGALAIGNTYSMGSVSSVELFDVVKIESTVFDSNVCYLAGCDIMASAKLSVYLSIKNSNFTNSTYITNDLFSAKEKETMVQSSTISFKGSADAARLAIVLERVRFTKIAITQYTLVPILHISNADQLRMTNISVTTTKFSQASSFYIRHTTKTTISGLTVARNTWLPAKTLWDGHGFFSLRYNTRIFSFISIAHRISNLGIHEAHLTEYDRSLLDSLPEPRIENDSFNQSSTRVRSTLGKHDYTSSSSPLSSSSFAATNPKVIFESSCGKATEPQTLPSYDPSTSFVLEDAVFFGIPKYTVASVLFLDSVRFTNVMIKEEAEVTFDYSSAIIVISDIYNYTLVENCLFQQIPSPVSIIRSQSVEIRASYFNIISTPSKHRFKSSGALYLLDNRITYLHSINVFGFIAQRAEYNSAVTIRGVGTIWIYDLGCINNAAIQDAGCLHITSYHPTLPVFIGNSRFTGNQASSGGAIRVNGNIIIAGSSFIGNRADRTGGALITSGSVACIIDSDFSDNGSMESGGTVLSFSSNLFILRSSFLRGVTRQGSGGAIATVQKQGLFIQDSTFTACKAVDGGAISTNAFMTQDFLSPDRAYGLFITNSTFSDNLATGNMPFDRTMGKLWPSETTVAESGRGGSLFAMDIQVVSVGQSVFEGNLGISGGALYIEPQPPSFLIYKSNFTSNIASYAGGALAIVTHKNSSRRHFHSSSQEVTVSRFIRNEATFGGGIWILANAINPSISFNDTVWKRNNATYGAAAYISGSLQGLPNATRTLFDENFAFRSGSTLFFNGATAPIPTPTLSLAYHSSEFDAKHLFGEPTNLSPTSYPWPFFSDSSNPLLTWCSLESGCMESNGSTGSHWGTMGGSVATSSFSLSINFASFLTSPDAPVNRSQNYFMTPVRVSNHAKDQTQRQRIVSETGNCRRVDSQQPWLDNCDLEDILMDVEGSSGCMRPPTMFMSPGFFKINFTLTDSLSQLIDDDNTYSTCSELVQLRGGNVSLISRPGSVRYNETTVEFLIGLYASSLPETSLYDPSLDVSQLFSHRLTLVIGVENATTGSSMVEQYEPHRFSHLPVSLVPINITSCPIGYGLQRYSDEPHLALCAPCPQGTYNRAGDGICWLCDDPSVPYTLVTCSGSTVRPLKGVYVLSMERSNQFSTFICPYGYCSNCSSSDSACPFGDCSEGRDPNSCLCGGCSKGYHESLVFDVCSKSMCKETQLGAVVFLLLLFAAFTIAIHHASFYYPSKLNTLVFFLQVLPLARVDVTSLLLVSKPLAHWACLSRATPLQRIFFYLLFPLYMVAVILIIFALQRITLKILLLFKLVSNKNANPKKSSILSSIDREERQSLLHSEEDIEEEDPLPENSVLTLSSSTTASISTPPSISSSQLSESPNDIRSATARSPVKSMDISAEVFTFADEHPPDLPESSVSLLDPAVYESPKIISDWDQRIDYPFFHSSRLSRTLLMIWMMTLIPSLLFISELFHCVDIPNRGIVWFKAPTVLCTGEKYKFMKSLATPMIIGNASVLTLLVFFALFIYQQHVFGIKKRSTLLVHLSFFYDSFRPRLYFWSLLHITERILLPLSVGLAYINPGIFNFSTSMLLLCATLIQAFAWSYIVVLDNLISCFSLTALTLISLLRDSAFQSSAIDYASPMATGVIVGVWWILLILSVGGEIYKRYKRH